MNDPNLHLFVDDHEIQHYTNLLRVLNKPKKHPEPVVTVDQKWEGCRTQAWGSVIQEPDGLLRMWYFSFPSRGPDTQDCGGYCYAESRDGIHWDKPPLGVAEWRGSRENNIWYPMSPDGKNWCDEYLARKGLGLPAHDEEGNVIGVINNLDGFNVVRDDEDPDPRRRYKLIANMQDHRMWAGYYPDRYPDATEADIEQAQGIFGQYLDTSPDGIHWTRKPRRILKARFGDYMLVTRDERNQRWWLNERTVTLAGRNAALRTSTDLIHWSDPPELVFESTPEMGYGKIFQWHGGFTPFNYGNLNLGLLEKWSNVGMGDTCELVCQREGGTWQRVAPGAPYLDVGADGDFDRTLIYPTHNEPLRIGDTLYIFYTGAGSLNHDNHGPIPMSMGVATIGLDRFAGFAHTREDPGLLLTKPIRIEHGRLEVNVESHFSSFADSLRVAVRDTMGDDIPGYTLEDSVIAYGANGIRKPVTWKDRPGLEAFKGKTVHLLFEVRGAILYSYRLYDG
jgi:hypothetical protein